MKRSTNAIRVKPPTRVIIETAATCHVGRDKIAQLGGKNAEHVPLHQHVQDTAGKAWRALHFVMRVLRKGSDKSKEIAYKSLVRPVMEYGAACWDPYRLEHIKTLEKIQKRALKRCRNNSPLKWDTLTDRRTRIRLCAMFKTYRGFEYLDSAFHDRWIGRGGPLSWPARSPDLSASGGFVWDHMKTKVYRSAEDLPVGVVAAVYELREIQHVFVMVRKAMIEVQKRIGTWFRERYCDDTPLAGPRQIQIERSLTPVSKRVGVVGKKREKSTASHNVLEKNSLRCRGSSPGPWSYVPSALTTELRRIQSTAPDRTFLHRCFPLWPDSKLDICKREDGNDTIKEFKWETLENRRRKTRITSFYRAHLGQKAWVDITARLEKPTHYGRNDHDFKIKCRKQKTDVDLEDDVCKKETPVDILRSLALETINLKCPGTEKLLVYTDGSKSEDDINVGAGVYSDIFAFYIAVGTHRSAYEGEIEGIRLALTQLICHQTKFKNVVILCDSKSATECVGSSDPESTSIQDCPNAIQLLQAKHKIVILQWVPGHCDLFGNEQADVLEKRC
ncbi:hypothetical protein ANN_14975 [Periplaneta americana]|uniref:RNase H type-1 domain-containing protein n=1 Tax=Periplaneta americana TaxID=6978 RepID=A0ABQ8SXR7_PERAM|nr:hypothetical protein ANN_14975 [Periplaneta americana]